MVSVSFGVGISMGQLVAGLMGPSLGWRAPFLVISLPALVLGITILCTVREPPRGISEEAAVKFLNRKGEVASESVEKEEVEGESSSYCPPLLPGSSHTDISNHHQDEEKDLPRERNSSSSSNGNSVNRNSDGNSFTNKRCSKAPPTVVYSERVDLGKLKKLFSTRTVVLAFLQGIPGCVPW